MAQSRWEPVSWRRMTDRLADRVAGMTADDGWLRVAVDGAPAAGTDRLADGLAEALPALGRPVLRIRSDAFWRPASLRFEYGRHDADAYYDRWLDDGALWREVFAPLGSGGDGRVLPSLWDPVADRATRAGYVTLPPGGVLLLDGPLLLGHGYPLDLAVHLRLSPAALDRRTPEDERWTLPAFHRYEDEIRPDRLADVLVRCDDPERPAWTG